MDYDIVIEFVRELLVRGHIRSYVVEPPFDNLEELDMGLRAELMADKYSREETIKKLYLLKDNVLYYLRDALFCEYICMKLPDTDRERFFIIGPYTFVKVDHIRFMDYLEKARFAPNMIHVMHRYYQEVQLISDETKFKVAVSALADKIWGADNYKLSYYENDAFWNNDEFDLKYSYSRELNEEKVKDIELHYKMENEIMSAVQAGNYKEIERIFRTYPQLKVVKKGENILRDYKNYLIILNALLRKAAEYGEVPLIYLDNLSTRMSDLIEEQTSPYNYKFVKEMIRKYCILVQNQSLRGYAPIVQDVINEINLNLSSDLSLKVLAEQFNISSGYLSSLFKKEVGITLTEYVNNKRIDHSVFLLNTTTMQIQDIATCCGFMDANYYSRIFKKRKGITPSKYHELIAKRI